MEKKRDKLLKIIVVLYIIGLGLRIQIPVGNETLFWLHIAGVIALAEIFVMAFRHDKMDKEEFENV